MNAIELRPGIFWVGVNDHQTDYFEGLWPIIEEGVSYNSYLINDQKKVLIDLTKELTTEELFRQIQNKVDFAELDYLVINHMEPDHSGAIAALLRVAPQITMLGTQKTQNMLKSFYGLGDNFRVVADGEELSLGDHTLRFVCTPNVHWPETMMTFETSQQILFSCDAFGSYGALQGGIFDDDVVDKAFYIQEAQRYYANIVSLFKKAVLNAIKKLEQVPVKMVAPSHGLIWRKDPQEIVTYYKKWSEYCLGAASRQAGITMLTGSMYGSTMVFAESVAQGVLDEGLPLKMFDVLKTHSSYILSEVMVSEGILIGAPTYEGGIYPPMAHMLDELARKRFAADRTVARFGSFGWNGGGMREFDSITATLNWEVMDSIEFCGAASPNDLQKARALGAAYARKVKERIAA
jgi:flavorubredoxin